MRGHLTYAASALALAVMFAATGVRAQTNAATEAAGASALPGDEIVVTAQKRAESVLDVPVAVTAIRQETLLERGATTISEISAFTPGLQVGSGRAGTVLTIRGINSGNDPAAATGVIIDGAPIGSSSAFAAGGSNAFDLDPSDIQRVEVLRGPQGTLFGASTLGGLVAYVTRRPSLTQFGGSAGGEVATTANGDESYLVRGAIDAPLIEDRLGVRVSGFYDRRGGFIDNQVTGGNNLNDTTRRGGRVAVYARPTDRIDINVWYGRQRLDVDGPEYILTDARGGALAGPYEYNQRYNPNRNQVADVVNGTVDIDFDAATLSYIGSYQNVVSFISRNATNSPITSIINLAGVLGLSPRLPAPPTVSVDFDFKLRKNSHELRLASNSDGPLQWIVGGFFTFEDASQNQIYEARTAVGAAVPSFEPVLEAGLLSTFKEYAGFANLTYEILPGLDLTGGIRIGRNIQRYQQTGGGVSLPGFNVILRQLTGIPSAGLPVLTPVAASRESQETYLANLAYSFGERSLFYARFASGYRPGGPNTVVPGGDPTFEPDEVDSYELGYKGEILDRRLRVEIAAYRIDWKNIQLVRTVAGLNTRFNGASARSEGVEFSLAAFPTTGLTISLTGAYGDARVNEAVPAVGAVAGERLPYAPTWSATGTVDYTFPITDGVSGVVGGVLRMVGDRNTSFLGSTTYTNIALDSYALADLRAGLQFGDVEISAFARNITNSQARLAGFSELSINEVNIARPRTIGLATSLRF